MGIFCLTHLEPKTKTYDMKFRTNAGDITDFLRFLYIGFGLVLHPRYVSGYEVQGESMSSFIRLLVLGIFSKDERKRCACSGYVVFKPFELVIKLGAFVNLVTS